MFKKALFALLLILFTVTTSARELTDMSLDVAAATKQEAFDQATEEATRRLTEEILGPERAARVWPNVRPKLLKNSSRYVLFIKGSAPTEAAGQTKIQVQMRLSPDNLEALLREAGALGAGTVRLLPLIAVSEPRGTRYVWWADASSDPKTTTFAQELFRKLFQQINAKFKGKNIYVLDPTNASFRMSIPSAYRSEGLRREDQILLAQYLKADVVLSGRVDAVKAEGSATRLNYDLQLWQAKSGRGLSEVQRSEPVSGDSQKLILAVMDPNNDKVIDELGTKLQEAMHAGSLNLNVVRISVEGSLAYKQQQEFKRQLGSVREIKTLRERLFEPGRVTFEAETAVSGSELGKSLQRTRFSSFRVDVEGAQDDSLVLNVRPTSAQ